MHSVSGNESTIALFGQPESRAQLVAALENRHEGRLREAKLGFEALIEVQ